MYLTFRDVGVTGQNRIISIYVNHIEVEETNKTIKYELDSNMFWTNKKLSNGFVPTHGKQEGRVVGTS